MLKFAVYVLAFLFIVQIDAVQQSKQSSSSSFLRCLSGYRDKYVITRKKKQLISSSSSVTVNFSIVHQIKSLLNAQRNVRKHAKIHI